MIGEYARFSLSKLNGASLANGDFPTGTFVANVMGTWVSALLTTISKFTVDYYNIAVQSVIYGLQDGFCGYLTTVSTLVVSNYCLYLVPRCCFDNFYCIVPTKSLLLILISMSLFHDEYSIQRMISLSMLTICICH